MSNSSWCPVPWKSLSVRNNGDLRVCCHANTSESKGLMRDVSGKLLNAQDCDINSARNSATLSELRLSMLKGERHPICQRCNNEDDSKIKSRRTYEKSYWSDSFDLELARRATHSDGTLDFEKAELGYFDFRFGNLCNLKCRMCGPTESSLWMKEDLETRINSEQFTYRGNFEWYNSESFWRQIRGNVSDLRKVYCVGGEPLLIDAHYDFLEFLIEGNKSKDIVVEYNSNVTILPDRAVELWRHFKKVRIGASIDAVGVVNDYIRYPSRWDQIERNLDLLDSVDAPLEIWLAPTVQILNIYYLTDFIKWRLLKKFKRINRGRHSPFLTLHPLHNPAHYNIQALPQAVKEAVSQKFDDFYSGWFSDFLESREGCASEKITESRQRMETLLSGYKRMMWKKDLSHHMGMFWRETKIRDKYRKQSFFESLPEFAALLAEESDELLFTHF